MTGPTFPKRNVADILDYKYIINSQIKTVDPEILKRL